MEFEVGDKVRALGTGFYPKGTICTVSEVHTNHFFVEPNKYGSLEPICWELVERQQQTKFKVGDKVKCINDEGYGLVAIGKIYTIERIDVRGNLELIEVDKNFFYRKEQFELVEQTRRVFKVGDRVEVIRTGVVGVIRDIDSSGIPYRVETPNLDSLWTTIEGIKPARKTTTNKNIDEMSKEEIKMEKPKTNLEKEACKRAKQEAIEKEIKVKQMDYEETMRNFINQENLARKHRDNADRLREVLGVTDKEMKELF